MCAIGHYLEDEGLATVSITLVRPHVEAVKPPRSLWVPFELGRPLGAPDNPEFQHEVLAAALALLVSDAGPVLLADFAKDAPDGTTPQEGWACPVALKPPPDAPTGLTAAIVEEVAALRPWHDVAQRTRGHTTVGVSGIDITEAAQFVASQMSDSPRKSYREGLGLGDALKLATDDIKAFYLEAATAQPGAVTSATLNDWFWGETTAGKVFLALKGHCARSDEPVMKALARFILVPRAQLHRLPSDD